jgi:integrase
MARRPRAGCPRIFIVSVADFMDHVMLDTDVFSYLMKGGARADPYRPHTEGKRIAISFVTVAALKLPGVSHHTFRHAGATVMVANSVSLRAVQMIGGWTSLRMVERYAHLDDAELQRAVRVTHNHTAAAQQGGTAGDTATGTGDRKVEQANGTK